MNERIIHISERGDVDIHPEMAYESFRERVLRTAIGLGLQPTLRGKHLDRLLSPLHTGASDQARRSAFELERYVSMTHENIPIFPDPDLPEPDLMEDIKITGGPIELKMLVDTLGIQNQEILTEIEASRPTFLKWTKDAALAWSDLRPRRRATVRFTIIPEPPHISYIRLDDSEDHFGLPAVAIIKSPEDLKYGRPFQVKPFHYQSLSITGTQSGNPMLPDLRTPGLAPDIDTLTAPIESVDGILIPRLPTLPDVIRFPEKGVRCWTNRIRDNTPFPGYALLDIFSRWARKSAFHGIPSDDQALQSAHFLATLANLSSPVWNRDTLSRLERNKLRWEWEAAYRINKDQTKELLHIFRIPKFLYPRQMQSDHTHKRMSRN